MRMRRKPNLVPRLERCSHLMISNPAELRGHWLELFEFKKLFLEIGCGKGRFIAQTAVEHPDTLFIAIEKTANVLVAAMELIERESVQNVRFVNSVAEQLTEFFAPGELSRIYINFCDPWPSNRHKKRRLVSGDFLMLYKEVLSHGGEVHFKTDNRPLFDFALQEFENYGFTLLDKSYNLHESGPVGKMTEYEQKFVEQGVPICQCIAIKDSI